MEVFYLGSSRILLEYSPRDLESRKSYFAKLSDIKELNSVVYEIVEDNSIPQFFTKLLYSNHELEMYKKMKGTGISPEFIGTSRNNLGTFLILEKMESITYKFFKSNEKENISDIINKLRRMHSLGIIHRDIRKDNLLVRNGEIFFCDFENKGYSTRWAPKEVIEFGIFSKESDIYSLGCLLIELITEDYPWGDNEDYESDIEKEEFSRLLYPVKDHPLYKFIEDCIVRRCV